MISNKKHRKILTFLFVVNILFLLLSTDISALSATINVESTQEKSDDIVTLKVSGLTHVETSGFKIRLNYNNSAFEYISTDFPNSLSGASKSAETNSDGILTVECSHSYISIGENDYFSVNLKAKNSGAASILIASSTFYDLQGNNISGSMLKYFTVEINHFEKRGSISDGQGNSTQLTGPQNESENSTSIPGKTKTTTNGINKNTDKTSEINSSTTDEGTTSSNAFSTEEINQAEASKFKYDFKVLILISALIILIFIVSYLFKKSNRK